MYEFILTTGVIVPDTSAIKAQTEAEWREVFGDDMDLSPETPQGIMVAQEVLVRSEVAANNAALANQINPNYAGGVFLDDIWALTGGKRRGSDRTIVRGVELFGIPGTTVRSGTRRQTEAGDMFELTTTVVLDSKGWALGEFRALEDGEVPCPTHTLTKAVIGYTPLGLERTDNALAGTLGQLEQSDPSARNERKHTLAIQGRSLAEAVYSRVHAVYGVKSMSFRENFEDEDMTIDNVFLRKNSMWCCVDGGAQDDIVEALYKSKSGGCGYNGEVETEYQEPIFGQKHIIKFDRPSDLELMVRITSRIVGPVFGDPEAMVKQAVMDYQNGLLENSQGWVLGAAASPIEIGSAVKSQVTGLLITNVELAFKSITPEWVNAIITPELWEKCVTTTSDIQVVWA